MRLEVFRPVPAALDTQIAALSLELEAAAPQDLPRGLASYQRRRKSRSV